MHARGGVRHLLYCVYNVQQGGKQVREAKKTKKRDKARKKKKAQNLASTTHAGRRTFGLLYGTINACTNAIRRKWFDTFESGGERRETPRKTTAAYAHTYVEKKESKARLSTDFTCSVS